MALFTDSDLVTLDDLLQFESTLVQVSSTHGIDINTKIKLAKDEIGDKILLFLLRAGQSDHQWFSRATGLNTVFVTPAISKWLCCNSLYRVFAEAYNLQLNTRFQGKMLEYQRQADAASEIVFASGIGVIGLPLSRPGLPTLEAAVGVMTTPALFVQTTWVNAAGQESAPSPVNGLVLNGFSKVTISMGSSPESVPVSATGWNVYASTSQRNLTKQNTQLIAVGDFWEMPESGVVLGSSYSGPQTPNVFISASRRWNRG
jgi:hypothetical protein